MIRSIFSSFPGAAPQALTPTGTRRNFAPEHKFPLSRVPFPLLVLSTLLSTIACSTAKEPSGDATAANGTRYGLFNLLDQRSSYGQDAFPEPFLVDDSALEVNEARLDWLHTGANDQHSDVFRAELERGFGLMTLELEIPFERDVSGGELSEGVGNISIGARYPLWQIVSSDGSFDTTFGAAIEIGIPVNSSVSRNTEIVPKIFNDLRVGNHVTLQAVFGYSTLLGGGEEGGLQTLESGLVLGYTLQHSETPLPGIEQLIPILELKGETKTNRNDSGQTSLLGNLGFRANVKSIGAIQPRVGLGFVFPIEAGARKDVHWGVVTSLVFEY